MPHLIIEISDQTLFSDPDELLLALNKTLLLSQEFEAHDIKSRLYIADNSLVGIDKNSHAFISITLKIMPGRSPVIKQQLIDGLISTTNQLLDKSHPQTIEITVEVIELNRPVYRKFMVN